MIHAAHRHQVAPYFGGACRLVADPSALEQASEARMAPRNIWRPVALRNRSSHEFRHEQREHGDPYDDRRQGPCRSGDHDDASHQDAEPVTDSRDLPREMFRTHQPHGALNFHTPSS